VLYLPRLRRDRIIARARHFASRPQSPGKGEHQSVQGPPLPTALLLQERVAPLPKSTTTTPLFSLILCAQCMHYSSFPEYSTRAFLTRTYPSRRSYSTPPTLLTTHYCTLSFLLPYYLLDSTHVPTLVYHSTVLCTSNALYRLNGVCKREKLKPTRDRPAPSGTFLLHGSPNFAFLPLQNTFNLINSAQGGETNASILSSSRRVRERAVRIHMIHSAILHLPSHTSIHTSHPFHTLLQTLPIKAPGSPPSDGLDLSETLLNSADEINLKEFISGFSC